MVDSPPDARRHFILVSPSSGPGSSLVGDGQSEIEGRPFALFALHPEFSAMRFDDTSADEEAEARTRSSLGARPVRFENVRLVLSRNAWAGIDDSESRFGRMRLRRYGDDIVRATELDGIAEQIPEHL